jgi:hypothetical protein
VQGTGKAKEFELPYKGKTLRGNEIVDLCNKWAAKGVLEPDAAQSIIGLVRNKNWSDFSNKVRFYLIFVYICFLFCLDSQVDSIVVLYSLFSQLGILFLFACMFDSFSCMSFSSMNSFPFLTRNAQVFVMLGAGAAMGPFLTLMAMGANVVAIDIDIPAVWERLLTVAQNSAGTFTFPLKKPREQCATPKVSSIAALSLCFSFVFALLIW